MKKIFFPTPTLFYFILSLVFTVVFQFLHGRYIYPDSNCRYPIDSIVFYCREFRNTAYLIEAKHFCYNIPGYFSSFFLLDLVYPIAYTFFFIGVLQWMLPSNWYVVFLGMAVLGGLFDYAENISFAFFLTATSDKTAPVTAFFTDIKTVFFLANILVVMFCMVRFWKNRKRIVL